MLKAILIFLLKYQMKSFYIFMTVGGGLLVLSQIYVRHSSLSEIYRGSFPWALVSIAFSVGFLVFSAGDKVVDRKEMIRRLRNNETSCWNVIVESGLTIIMFYQLALWAGWFLAGIILLALIGKN